MKKLLFILMLLPSISFGADYDFWANDGVDSNGNAPGYMNTTPFPIDENSTTYTLTNDEGDTVYILGTKYFVDADCSNGITVYDPAGDACTGGSETSYSSIGNAISAVSAGNKTIIVRAGTYNEYNLSIRAGTDNTHRYMIVGYKQERPIIDGIDTTTTSSVISLSTYSTLQRVKVQEHYYMGSRAQADYGNIIDSWYYNTNTGSGDGNIYAAGSDGLFIHHTTSERVCGHAFKISDTASNSLIEWSVAKEFGYWSGLTVACRGSNHPSGFDYPDTGANHVLRYSQAYTGLFYAIQFRPPSAGGTVSVHHNEIWDTTHFDDVTGEAGHVSANQVLFNNGSSGTTNFYSNIVRDSSDNGAYGVYITGDANIDTFNIYNNLFYGNNGEEIRILGSSATINLWNNSFYDDDNDDALVNSGAGSGLDMKNNTFYQAGTSSCLSVGSATHTYNRYYAPNGSIGVSLGTGEVNGDPNWESVPTGAYADSYVTLQATDAGIDLSGSFLNDFLGVTRGAWDRGAKEFESGVSSSNILGGGSLGSGSIQ